MNQFLHHIDMIFAAALRISRKTFRLLYLYDNCDLSDLMITAICRRNRCLFPDLPDIGKYTRRQLKKRKCRRFPDEVSETADIRMSDPLSETGSREILPGRSSGNALPGYGVICRKHL